MTPADYQHRRQQIEMQQQMGQQQPMDGYAMTPQSQQSMGSPLSQGSHQAITAARQALEPDEDQRRRAMGAGMGTFFGLMGQNRPVGQTALGAMAQAMSPAVQTYQQELAQQEALNYQMMHERQKQQQAQDKLGYMMHALQQKQEIEEQRRTDLQRHRAESLQLQREKIGAKAGVPGVESEFPPIKTASERRVIGESYRNSLDAGRKIDEIFKDVNRLKKHEKESVFSPAGSIVPGASKARDYAAKVLMASGADSKLAKDLHDERLVRERLNTQFEHLQPVIDKALKGGVAGEQMMKRLHEAKAFPSKEDTIESMENKLKVIRREVDRSAKLNNASLKKGQYVSYLPGDEVENEEPTENERARHNAEFLEKGKQEMSAKPAPNVPNTVFDMRRSFPEQTKDMTDEEVEEVMNER